MNTTAAAETTCSGDVIPRLQTRLAASPAGCMHQSVIMCSTAVVEAAGGVLLKSHATPRWTAHSQPSPAIFFTIGSSRLNFLLGVQGHTKPGLRVMLAACMHALYACLRCCHVSSRS